MADYDEFLGEHLRIALLKALLGLPSYRANDSVLADAVRSKAALFVSRDRVRTEISWLTDQGLVTAKTDEMPWGLQDVTLTRRGQDVAEGNATVPGVKRPSAR